MQETLILPLYSRKLCTELYPNLYRDETAVRLIDQIDYDFSEAEENSRSLMQRFGALEVAMRQNDLAFEVRAYLKNHPGAAVVNLGCGLDNTGRACDNGRCKIYNLDFPDVITLRQQLLPAGEREQNIPCDLKDPAWFDRIDATGGAVFFVSGVFYYFLTEQVRELVQGMADAFPGGVLALLQIGFHGLLQDRIGRCPLCSTSGLELFRRFPFDLAGQNDHVFFVPFGISSFSCLSNHCFPSCSVNSIS